jgi:hypothetical protein
LKRHVHRKFPYQVEINGERRIMIRPMPWEIDFFTHTVRRAVIVYRNHKSFTAAKFRHSFRFGFGKWSSPFVKIARWRRVRPFNCIIPVESVIPVQVNSIVIDIEAAVVVVIMRVFSPSCICDRSNYIMAVGVQDREKPDLQGIDKPSVGIVTGHITVD